MMNFDPVAGVYDATRGLGPDVSELVADRIAAATHATPESRFLEIGVGTGRIALPLVQRGYRFTGVDISEGMLQRFRDKVGDMPNLTLIQGDVTTLPLPNASQDVVLVIHVFHLIPEWRTALAEARRVLRPSGALVWGGNDSSPGHPGVLIRQRWSAAVKELGGTLQPRYATWEQIHAETNAQGAYTAVYRVARWPMQIRPLELMEALRDRVYSATWIVEQDVLDAAHERLLAWGREHFGDLEQPIETHEEFLTFVTQWPEERAEADE